MMEREKDHFAHEHPLIFNESEEQIPHCCNACGLRVLSSPYYLCAIQDCSFYLHQACSQLPHKLHHYFRHKYGPVVEHTLDLLAKPRDDNCRCGDCGKLCKNFTYHCSKCEFVLHPQCGSALDIQIKHISHPQHPMVAMRKEALLLCDVCGRDHKGYFFSCHQCDFWIHQDCALLPILVKVEEHPHHLSLFYSAAALLGLYIKDFKCQCLFCGEMALKRFGLYYCLICEVIAHVDCTTSHMKDSGVVLHLPTKSDDTFPSLIVRTRVKELAIKESNSKDMLEKYHAHSLVLTDGSTAQESICNACVKPISPPYYNCSAPSECNFLLHKFCADLPLSIKHSSFNESDPGSLGSTRWDGFFRLFHCYRCGKYNNGFGYKFSNARDVDIDCAFSPIIIKHDSHDQHPLILLHYRVPRTHISCCGQMKSWFSYHCSLCKWAIHIDCARLPKTVTHKFDKHPLTLTYASSNSQHHSNDHLCEFCEEDIDPKYWFYHCTECDQSFHVDCIPSTGEYSRIKFGGTMKVHCHSDHPLTLVRTMSVCSQTCGYCDEIIQGFEDGMALHCPDCDFWIHLECGYRSSGANISSPRKLKCFFVG
ncbi:uncharacterized protein [Primulina eburnea]|uniref:uncharacterized protein n=1 Tax=Primulina eburnea TaxID=1245227 RepID=UPI003C6C517F